MYKIWLDLSEPCVVRVAVRALMVHKMEWRLSFLLTVIAQDHLQRSTSCQAMTFVPQAQYHIKLPRSHKSQQQQLAHGYI